MDIIVLIFIAWISLYLLEAYVTLIEHQVKDPQRKKKFLVLGIIVTIMIWRWLWKKALLLI